MTVRSLPVAEWARLSETGADMAQIQQAATTGDVLVVEDGDQILACAVVMLCAHLEGVWVHPDYRHDLSVGRRLWRAVKQTAHHLGARGFFGSAVNPQSEHMIESLGGVQLEGRHFVMGLGHGRG